MKKKKKKLNRDISTHWIKNNYIEKVKNYALENLAKAHLEETKKSRTLQINKIEIEVTKRLKSEINRLYGKQHLSEKRRMLKTVTELNLKI